MDVHPGSHKYRHSQSIPFTLGSASAVRGDSLAVGASGDAVLTTGDNPFLGVLQSATQGDLDAGNLGPGVDDAVVVEAGDTATVAVSGAVRAKVSAFDSGTGGTVSAGEALSSGSGGSLVTTDDGTGAAVVADVGEPRALSDEDADGFAVCFLG